MLIKNKKSGHEAVVKPEDWASFKQKDHPTDPRKTFQDMYEIVDESATQLPGTNVPDALKVFNSTDSKTKSESKKLKTE